MWRLQGHTGGGKTTALGCRITAVVIAGELCGDRTTGEDAEIERWLQEHIGGFKKK
jgi:hypothetical protein